MSSEGTLAVSAAVVAITQVLKWAKLPDHWGPLVVILLSGIGVFVWLMSGDSWPPSRTDIWPIVTGWIAVTLTAAGTFGFTRAGAEAVSRATGPPDDGAGSSATDGNDETLADEILAMSPAERLALTEDIERRQAEARP